MRFAIEGKEYEWDGSHLTVEESMILKDKTGMGLVSWNACLADRDGYAEAALIFLAKRRAGEAIRWQDLAGMDIATLKFLPELGETDPDDQEGEAKPERPDPTRSGGKTRRKGTSTTS